MRNEAPSVRDQYVEGLYAQEDDVLAAIRNRLEVANRWGVNIGANEGKMLQVLMKSSCVHKAVEIGTLFAYSTIWIARALPEEGVLYTLERDPHCVAMAKLAIKDAKLERCVTLIEGDATEKLKELSVKGPFDFVFIDANKSAYVEYLEWAYQNLRLGGLLIADNTLLGGLVLHEEKPQATSQKQWSEMRRFNEMIADSSKFIGTMFPTSEGLTVAVRV